MAPCKRSRSIWNWRPPASSPTPPKACSLPWTPSLAEQKNRPAPADGTGRGGGVEPERRQQRTKVRVSSKETYKRVSNPHAISNWLIAKPASANSPDFGTASYGIPNSTGPGVTIGPVSSVPVPAEVPPTAGGKALAGFLLSGFLLALLGAILPAWGYHRDPPDFVAVGKYFLSLAVGIVAAAALARPIIVRRGLTVLLVFSCARSCPGP